jgi:hypothetical protein
MLLIKQVSKNAKPFLKLVKRCVPVVDNDAQTETCLKDDREQSIGGES